MDEDSNPPDKTQDLPAKRGLRKGSRQDLRLTVLCQWHKGTSPDNHTQDDNTWNWVDTRTYRSETRWGLHRSPHSGAEKADALQKEVTVLGENERYKI